MSITATHGTVYRALAANGSVLYIGMSTRPAQRLKEHASKSEWWPLAASVEQDEPLPLSEAFISECDQIVQLRPAFNRNAGCAQGRRPDPTTEAQMVEWRTLYESGQTIEEIALDAGLSAPTIRKHLLAVGTTMRLARPRKGRRQKPSPLAKPPASDPVVHVAFAGARNSHRRRGGKRAA